MLKLQLLGGRRLLQGRRDISAAIHYRKGWALLGYLAVERGKRHSREEIAQLLWPNLEATAARTNLRQVLANLNQVFGSQKDSPIEITREDMLLSPTTGSGLEIDLLALEDGANLPMEPDDAAIPVIEKLAQQFGGQFMAGFSLPECLDFDNWLTGVRHRVAGMTEEAFSRLCRVQQLMGRIAQATASARRLAALDEWNEDYRRQLMLLLAESGLHQQALDQYQSLSDGLQAELGTSPEQQTQVLRTRIEADFRRVRAGTDVGMRPLRPQSAMPGRMQSGEITEVDRLPTQRTIPVAGTEHGGPMQGWLILGGDVRGPARRIAIAQTPVVIGRSRDCVLCIHHDTVSRQHCVVWRGEGGFRIRDLGSTNGTRVNGASVQEAVLGDGDGIVLGEMQMRFSCTAANLSEDDITC